MGGGRWRREEATTQRRHQKKTKPKVICRVTQKRDAKKHRLGEIYTVYNAKKSAKKCHAKKNTD